MGSVPLNLRLKAALIGTPLESAAQSLRKAVNLHKRFRHPDLAELQLEGDRIEACLRKLLKQDSNCVDVGCHIGSFLAKLYRLAPNGRHIAIEASEAKAAILRRHFPSSTIHCCAVGSKEGTATFYESSTEAGHSSLTPVSVVQYESMEVSVKTIDSLLCDERRIDFIKLDIEGGEPDALKGATVTLKRHRPALLFECGAETGHYGLLALGVSRSDLYEFIKSQGYEIYAPGDLLFDKGPLCFDEFRKCGLYPFRAFNFFALPQ